MRIFPLLLLLVPCWNSSCSEEANNTIPEGPLTDSLDAQDDSEQELSSQLEEVESRSNGWSSWSDWSACSRSCDGGTSHQLRTCKTGSCKGDHVRYKICNMQVFVAALAFLALSNASLLPTAKIVEGPSTRTTITGPDGSIIQSVSPGGKIITEESPAVVAEAAPVVAAPLVSTYTAQAPIAYAAHTPVAYSAQAPVAYASHAPLYSTYSAPLLSYRYTSSPVLSAYSAPLLSAYSAPVVSAYSNGLVAQKSVDTVVAGPSGTISTSKTVASPAAVVAPAYAYAAHGLFL